jgi:hypothetical protein
MEQQSTEPAGSNDIPELHTEAISPTLATGALGDPVSDSAEVDAQYSGQIGTKKKKSTEPVEVGGVEHSTGGEWSEFLRRLRRRFAVAEHSYDPDVEKLPEKAKEGKNVHGNRRSSVAQPESTNEGKIEDGPARKLASWILKPMGLWVDTRSHKLFDDDNSMNGFPRVTTFIASDPDNLTSIYRRFDRLNIRNLLLLEAKVAALEALQEKFDDVDAANYKVRWADNFAMNNTHWSFEDFALLGEGKTAIEADTSQLPGQNVTDIDIKSEGQLESKNKGENVKGVK